MFITHHYAKASYFRDPACSSAHLPFTVQSCIFDGRQAVWCEQTFWIYSHFQHHIALCRVGLDFNQILLTGAEAVLEAAVICLDDRNITGWWLNTNTPAPLPKSHRLARIGKMRRSVKVGLPQKEGATWGKGNREIGTNLGTNNRISVTKTWTVHLAMPIARWERNLAELWLGGMV